MNPQTEPSEEQLQLPNTTSSVKVPASGCSKPSTTVVNEKLQDDWSSANTFCNAAGSFLDPVSLLFGGEGGGHDDDEMPGETLLADDSVTSHSSTLPGDSMSPVTESVEEMLSPGYQKRGRFLIWPTTLGGPMGFPLGLRTN
jgi:hypothetical protein